MRTDDDRLFTVAEACTWLGISDRTFRRLRQKGVLHAAKIGGSVRIRESELLRLVADLVNEDAEGPKP
ncbi:helix-turn-helix domain-containing protein [Dankookia rubra]|nr:helix-turn-helix domain-containing protein [Dankookia rubra]